MEKFLKTTICLTLAVVATMNYSCKKDDNSSDDYTVYDKADGFYYGNAYNTGTACFIVDMYNAADDQIGIWIEGFNTLPSSFANFNITGSYSVASTGVALTCLGGEIDDQGISGSYVYNFNTQEFTMVTGGTFDVVLTNGKYVVTTNFTGKNHSTGASVSNLHYSFTGAIAFKDNSNSGGSTSLSFSDIVKSNYTATGTPGFLSTPGPSSWTGQLTPSTGEDRFYTISGWGGKNINVFCDFNNGKIVIDNYTEISNGSVAGYSGYFQALALDKTAMTYYPVKDDYIVAYDKVNKKMDFSGTYNGLPVYVGVVAQNNSTGDIDGAFTELYANAKLTLTAIPQASSSAGTMKAEEFSCSASVTPGELKNYRMAKESGIKKSTGFYPAKKIFKE